MRRDRQLELIRRLLKHQEEGSTAYAPETWRNELSAYADPARAEREREIFFRQRPLPFGLSGRLAEPGDYVTDNIDGNPLLITRDSDGVVHAFLNVCRHRGAPVAEGCGKAKMFACPYHAWTYNLDGSLKGIPDARSFDGVDKSELGLTEIPALDKDGMIWIGPLDRTTPMPENPMGSLSEEFSEWDFGSYHFFGSYQMVKPMNWKLVIDTFLETYHINVLHKNTIAPYVQTNRATFDAFGDHHRMVAARNTLLSLNDMPEDERDLIPHAAIVYGLFPTMVGVVQGAANIELWRVWPDKRGPGWSVIELSAYVPEKPTSEKARNFWQKNMQLAIDTVEAEDFELGRIIQQNAENGAPEHVVYGRNEPAMSHYHSRIRAHLGLNSTV